MTPSDQIPEGWTPIVGVKWLPDRRTTTFAEDIVSIAFGFFIVGLVVGLPVFTFLRLMGWW